MINIKDIPILVQCTNYYKLGYFGYSYNLVIIWLYWRLCLKFKELQNKQTFYFFPLNSMQQINFALEVLKKCCYFLDNSKSHMPSWPLIVQNMFAFYPRKTACLSHQTFHKCFFRESNVFCIQVPVDLLNLFLSFSRPF